MFTRGLTRWLKLPGLARSASPVWVTPRGVKPDIIGIQRAMPRLAYFLVDDWVARVELFEPVEAMFVSVGGELVAHPVTVGDRTDPVIGAFLDERLWLWQLPALAVPAPAVFPDQPAKPGEQPALRSSWIEIVLVDQDGKPIADEPYRLIPSDGVPRQGNLDRNGFARIEGIEPGPCDVLFPKLDGREWSATGPSSEGDLREGAESFIHYAGSNDCLSSIAAKYRFRRWRTVYDNELNGDLRSLRTDANVLAPGDAVWIDRRERVELRPTEARHRFETVTNPTLLRLRLERMEPTRYELTVDGVKTERALAAPFTIEHPIPPTASSAELRLFFGDGENGYSIRWALDLGALRPVDLVRGVKERLNNLGFGAGKENDKDDPQTRRAVAAFQVANGDVPTGRLDDSVRQKVRGKHDVG